MVAFSIAAAQESGLFDRIVVSTDDTEIAQIAVEHGAEVPFLRDPSLADDLTPVSSVTLDVVQKLELDGHFYTNVAQLMPNCPLRNAGDVRGSYASFIDQPHKAQVSVTRYGWQNPWWALVTEDDGAVRPVFEERLLERSQDLPVLYCPTGAIWWIETSALKSHGTFHIPKRALYELPWKRAVDIDDWGDLELAELLGAHAAIGLSDNGSTGNPVAVAEDSGTK